MCKFKSAIVVQDLNQKHGFRLLLNPWTESHSDLIALHNLRDDGVLRFARVEFSPESLETAHQPETYKLTIDEERKPDWFGKEMKKLVSDRLREYIKFITVTGKVKLLLGGEFVLAPGADVGDVKTSVIHSVNSAKIDSVSGSAKIVKDLR